MSQHALLEPANGNAESESLVFTTDEGGVATIAINRQDRHNAFDDNLILELTDTFESCAGNSGLRVVVLTGNGKSFSSGADLEWMRSMAECTYRENREDAIRLAKMMASLAAIPQPTVARINGSAFGGGVGLICCCDLAIASSRAKFALTEVRLGLAPAVISPYVVAAIGVRQCQRYFQTGELIDTDRAVQLGLVHEVVDHDYLDTAVDRQVRMLLKGGPNAQAANKRLIERAKRERCATSMSDYTAELIAELRVSPEGQEGVSAFLEKRAPAFM